MHMCSTHLMLQQNDCSLLPPNDNNNIQGCLLLAIIHFICDDGDGVVRGGRELLYILSVKSLVVVVVREGDE